MILVIIAAAVGAILSFQITGRFTDAKTAVSRVEMEVTRVEASREMGVVVRKAYDFAQSGACPAGTSLLKSDGGNANLCWPTQDSGCLKMDHWFICRAGAAITRYPWSLVPEAVAVETVTVRMPVCAGAPSGTTCADCTNARTKCVTMRFCVERKKTGSCSDPLVQTYAIRNY